jgi:hypothetical protein
MPLSSATMPSAGHHLADVVDDALRRQRKARIRRHGRASWRGSPLRNGNERRRVGQPPSTAIGEQAEARTDVADDLGVRK